MHSEQRTQYRVNAVLMLLMTTLLLASCQYELSPWETDPDCSHKVSIAYNIERLRVYEQQVGIRTDYQVAVLSDPQQYPGSFETLIEHVNTLSNVDFILLTGDLADTGIKAEYEWACKVMEKSEKPIFAVIGNHDSLAFAEQIWRKVFGQLDYSFTYQNSKFIAYNDNKYEYANVPDRDWLTAETAGNDSRDHTIVFSHIAPWDEDLTLSQELKDMSVDLGIHGHAHNTDYWQLAGVMLPHYITSTTKKGEFGLLSVNSAGLTMETCTLSSCSVQPLRTR